MKDIENNMDLPWQWKFVSSNPNLTMDFIKKTLKPSLFYELKHLINNKFCISDGGGVVKNMKKYNIWNWSEISNNININLNDIKDNMGFDWDWYVITKRKDITMENIKNNIQLPWNWISVYENPNLTVEFVKYLFDEQIININDLNTNIFVEPKNNNGLFTNNYHYLHENNDKHNEITKTFRRNYIEKQYREYMASCKIKQWWIAILLNPFHPVGKRYQDAKFKKEIIDEFPDYF